MVRNYQPQDSQALATIFKNAILAFNNSIYSPRQKQAWLGNHSDEFWQSRFEQTKPLVAVLNDVVVGFIEFGFENGFGEIGCFYVEPSCQNQGVGQALFGKVLNVAKDNHVRQIQVYASHIAKPFFEKQGFRVIQKNSVERERVMLDNWLMSCACKVLLN